tara:strand:+ start:8424 stop:9071 length:648 start_codon:yes stop_codon:yes gene_type:complete
MRIWWPHLRAAVVLTHLAAVVLMSLPSNYRLGSRSHWETPEVQADLVRWSNTLGVDGEEFEEVLWDWTQRYIRIRKKVTHPFLKYADYTGTRQGWTMFSGPRRRTGRYTVEVEVGGEFRTLFRTQDSSATWNRWQFEHNRVRKLMAKLTTHPKDRAYAELTRWIAKRVAEDFPQATRCKISLETWKTLAPEQHRAGDKPVSEPTRSQMFTLEDLR